MQLDEALVDLRLAVDSRVPLLLRRNGVSARTGGWKGVRGERGERGQRRRVWEWESESEKVRENKATEARNRRGPLEDGKPEVSLADG